MIDFLLAAIDRSSTDNVIQGGELISDHEIVSESDKEVIHSGMWEMYFDPASGEINRVDWSDEFRRMIGFKACQRLFRQHTL